MISAEHRAASAVLAEVYLPAGVGDTGGAGAICRALAARAAAGVRVETAAYLPDEELLLVVIHPASPADVEPLFAAIGVEPIRLSCCRAIETPRGPTT